MSLKHYLELAFKESRLTSNADLGKIRHLDGILQPNQENLILVYGGSFNPPHQGHIDVILSGLNPILAAVSIIILPSEDFHLRNKLAKSHSEFFLNMKRRADILDAIPSIPKQKVWVWPSTWYPFKTCIDALVRLTAADGFEVAFSHLIGPDNVIPNDPLDIFPYRLPRILVSNKARHIAAHFRPDGRPERWNGFEEWIRSEEGHVEGKAIHLNFYMIYGFLISLGM
ncbi:hypothetical protein BDV39DRAFT_174804 [Aspergillus sergii]|uniref:Cytidyltransferase-like domain-containing protein n=1 Tax=Aspergillus sergii TaxID=1034303 RepID=A0A5N6X6P2_9EURO|nr:hypothetical protein BDV39DRAFT_174804 [Aspergillus sergii]